MAGFFIVTSLVLAGLAIIVSNALPGPYDKVSYWE